MRQLFQQRLRISHAAGQLGEIHFECAADRVDARQRHVALGQHAFDTGFRHVERARQICVGHADVLELVLEGEDEVDGGAH